MKGTGDAHRTLVILSALVVAASLCALAARFTASATGAAAASASV
jgi:NNP family nitrate/nitrite transporter-like MFS transporter